MEASIAEHEQQAPEAVARTADARKMFRYSQYVDVGEGAAECEHARDGQCTDIEHFHAWCRLPNPYQHQDIREKGLAAKARKLRELRDPDSNASVVLDEQLAQLNDAAFVEVMIDELLAADWPQDYLDAQADVEAEEEFEHFRQDREEYDRLQPVEDALPEEERSESYRQLVTHMERYVKAIGERMKSIQEPKREQLRSRQPAALVGLIRARRVEEEADRAFLDAYNPWMWFVGTLKVEKHPTLGRPHLSMWADIGHKDRPGAGTMYGEAPEVIEALKTAFGTLQVALQRGSSGN